MHTPIACTPTATTRPSRAITRLLSSLLGAGLLTVIAAMPSMVRADSTGEVLPAAATGDFSSPTNALTCNNLVASASTTTPRRSRHGAEPAAHRHHHRHPGPGTRQ
jgi:hypothetical protein